MNLKLIIVGSKVNHLKMTSCQYFIKKTKNPRICAKKSSYNKSSFLGGVCPEQKNQFGVNDPEFELHLCSNHFGIISRQISQKISYSTFFDFRYGGPEFGLSPRYACPSQESKLAQLVSLLTQRIEEFNRFTRVSHRSSEPPLRGVSVDDVVFIEEKTENQVLASKFEEAKRNGRYIDLTELPEQKSEVAALQIDCPVCLDTFSSRNIVFLQCAHTICTDCLSNIVKRNIPQQCPVCRCIFL